MMSALSPSPALPATPSIHGLGGLLVLVAGVEKPLPLKGVKVRAAIVGPFVRTVVEQRYGNPYAQALEAVHIFPLPPGGAVNEMELRAGELVARADLREKAAAEKTFAEAREKGQLAALLTAERADVHTLRVTNLPPGAEVSVRIVIIEGIEPQDGRFTWRFPTTIAPRYLPGQESGHAGPGVLPDTDQVPDASRLQPPLRLQGGTRLDLEVELLGKVGKLESSLHAIRLDLDGGLRVAPSTVATLDRDFVLSWTTEDAAGFGLRAWTDGQYTAALVEAPAVGAVSPLPRDAVFVIDISGSMGGPKMVKAKEALQAALHGLLPGDRFRLIAFDDRVEQFAAGPTVYDDGSLARADRWIEKLQPRGGTEMLPAIQAALDGERSAGRLTTVLFITDGQAWNEDELAAAVLHRKRGARFFTLGIDTAVNESLMRRLAKVGGGTAQLCTPEDDIERVISAIEARFGSPLAEEVMISGDLARPEPGVLFAGQPIGLLLAGAPGTVTLTLRGRDGVQTLSTTPLPTSTPLGPLWARERVRWLEDELQAKPSREEAFRGEILAVALQHHIASRFTAFVVVEERVVTQGERVTVVQPAELPASWSEGTSGGAPVGGQPMPVVLSAPMRKALARAGTSMGGGGPSSPGAAAPAPTSFGGPPSAPQRPALSADHSARSLAPSSADLDAFGAPSEVADEAPDRDEAPVAGFFDKLKRAVGLEKEAKQDAKGMSAAAAPRARRPSSAPVPPPPPAAPPAPAPTAGPARAASMAAREEAAPSDLTAELARAQKADGSFDGDPLRTAAALLLLVLLGHTRASGDRRRTVTKAALYLQAHAGRPEVAAALAALAAAERGERPAREAAWAGLEAVPQIGPAIRAAAR